MSQTCESQAIVRRFFEALYSLQHMGTITEIKLNFQIKRIKSHHRLLKAAESLIQADTVSMNIFKKT